MVIAVTQAALSVWGCLLITENLLEYFSLTSGPVPSEKILVLSGGPHLPQQAHWTTHTFRHTHHEVTDMHTQHTPHIPHWLAVSCLLLEAHLIFEFLGGTSSPLKCCSLGQKRRVGSPQAHRGCKLCSESLPLSQFCLAHSDFSLKSCLFVFF